MATPMPTPCRAGNRSSSAANRVIIRAIGPELTQHGVADALHNPTLELHDGMGALIASNDNWGTTIIGGIITQNQVRDIMNSGYAPSNGLESAIIADLPPGNYTAIVQGKNNTTGTALVEAYDLDAAPVSRNGVHNVNGGSLPATIFQRFMARATRDARYDGGDFVTPTSFPGKVLGARVAFIAPARADLAN